MTRPAPQELATFATVDARRLAWLCGAALVLAAMAVNLRVLGFGFLYLRDDDVNVALNPHMGGLSFERLHWMFTDWSYVRRYIPLGWLGFSATYQIAGLDPELYHLASLGLYALNCGLVFVLVFHALRLFGEARPAGLGPWDVGAAALAAGWWASHPFRVETTAWISGNLYGQATALLLLSLVAYLRTYETSGARRAAWLGAAAAAYLASLLTYPIALGAPALLIGLDWLRSRADPAVPFRRLLAEKAAFLVPLAGVLAVTVAARFATTDVFGAVPGIRELPLASRVAQSAYVAAYYVWKPWWPVHLSPLYDTLAAFRPTDGTFLLSLAAVAATSALALLWLRRRPVFAVIWFGYLASAAPFFGLTEKPHMASDRYGCFLEVIAAAVIAAALSRLRRPGARVLASAVSLGVIALLGWLSWRQLGVWSDDRVQHAYVARGLTNAPLLNDFLSRQLILDFMRGDEGPASEAVAARLKASPADPAFLKAEAIIQDKRRISSYYGPVSFLAILQDQMGLKFARQGDLREANDHFEDALREDERFYQAAFDRALVLLRLGRCDDALRSFLQADHWAPAAGLPEARRRGFLLLLQDSARIAGKTDLAHAAARALAR